MADLTYLDKQVVTINDWDASNVDPTSAGYVGGENLILDTFNMIGGIVADHSAKVDDVIETAEDLLVELGMPVNWTQGLDEIIINDVPALDATTLPTAPSAAALPDYASISWLGSDTSLSTYTSDMWVALLNKVLDGITNGGTGIPAAVETAIHERNLDRQRVANEKAYNLGIADISSKALSFPQYAMQALANQVSLEILKQAHNSSNEIDIAASDLEQKNMNTMLDKAVAIESLLRAFWKDYNSMKFAGIESATKEVIAHIEAITKEREGILKLYETEANVYKATTEGQKNWYDAVSANNSAQLARGTLQLQKISTELKVKLEAYVAVKGLQEKILATIGGVSSNVMASGLNAGNVSVGASVSSQKSLSESFAHNETKSVDLNQKIDESHNFSHKGNDES
jgi:hypothetical protein